MIYEPSDDSYLLESVIPKYAKNKSVIDVGAGSGILAKKAKQSGAKSVIASDINNESISILKQKGISAINSNLFSRISLSKKFDVIICNPPYLPEDKSEDKESKIITTGGKRGDEFILKFLKQSCHHLNKNGIILLLVSSLTPKKKINNLLKELNFKKKIIASKKLFFEVIEVWEINH